MKTAFRVAALLAWAGLCGCAPRPSGSYQGYVEGEYVYVASALPGALTQLTVRRGQDIQAGQLLFELERESEAAAVREATHRLAQANARLDNLRKGRRPTELATLQAQGERARASLKLSEQELARRTQLSERTVISREELDTAQSQRDANAALVASLQADLETARLGAREDEIRAAEEDAKALTAALAKANWSLAQKSQVAPTNAWVHDTLYRAGEWVAAGSPVIALLPPTNLKVRFFVPQAELAKVKLGQTVSVQMDGLAAPLAATVNYIATQAEFTPPVIYSKENRAKLVFMVEAAFAPADAANLKPGQPADVKVAP